MAEVFLVFGKNYIGRTPVRELYIIPMVNPSLTLSRFRTSYLGTQFHIIVAKIMFFTQYIQSFDLQILTVEQVYVLSSLESGLHSHGLIIGIEKREILAFYGAQGRGWERELLSTGMPNSELRMHRRSMERFTRFRWYIMNKVLVWTDAWCVVIGDGSEFANAAPYAV